VLTTAKIQRQVSADVVSPPFSSEVLRIRRTVVRDTPRGPRNRGVRSPKALNL
jgi:hypothetical protein